MILITFNMAKTLLIVFEPQPLLYGGYWRENEVAQDDGRDGRSLWNKDFVPSVNKRF
jgi:hypothetical protein